ncbi:MAG: hypothetical protein Q8939_06700 [Bacteroidota bacterium]|nr:hypothetical protein [Bacteroidota bacterium]
MPLQIEQSIALICLFIWIGFVCSISFLEAWLKFRAPGVTVAIGLGIGRLVFHALNKVEWVFALAVTGTILWNSTTFIAWPNAFLLLALMILVAQTGWLLPRLDARADLRISGKPVTDSNTHIYFIVAEILKVVSLFIIGIHLIKR